MWLNAVPKTAPAERSPTPVGAESDRAQVERIRAGDAAAFEALFRTYYAALASFAFVHTESREVAEEIVQDLFLSIWTRRAEWEITTHLRSYLYVATLNRVRSFRRTQRVHRAAKCVLEMERSCGDQREAPERSDDALVHQEALTAIRAAIAALPERTREVFLLNRDGGLSYREVAVRLGITVKTVEFHMGRALASLRERLAEWQ
jgi:RNA polymerase sigma-70 factor (ECF subfamily)